jgi:glycosyltransferase involved in cell wall biosynthesis
MKSVDRPKAPLPAEERLPISAFVICMNEADYIVNCILSLKVCAEIVIVDSGSYDGTLEIIRAFIAEGWPIRLISQKWLGYAGQKQFALDQCSLPWCLSLDADERLDKALRAELPKLIAAPADIVATATRRASYASARTSG